MKSIKMFSFVFLLFIVLASVEAQTNPGNSKKWKEYKNKFKVDLLDEEPDKKA